MPHTSKKRVNTTPTKIRIIGGEWRSRKLEVLSRPGLRPTGDRMRETLFNWLAPYIIQSRCLDAFAGTGSLGLEALSRGASRVEFIETNTLCANNLRENLKRLEPFPNSAVAKVGETNFLAWVRQPNDEPFDIVFVDPPFADELWQQTLELLQQSNRLRDEALVYVETPKGITVTPPDNWAILKQKVSGQVCATLYKTNHVIRR
ncbi:MAG: 16S rRNA (guanine966-N2)-methyltransferase [Lentisphaeria bacterium]